MLRLGHHAATDHDARRPSRTPSPSPRPSAARPTPCCTCWRSPTRRGSNWTLDDFNRIAERVPTPRRHEARRQVPHERPRSRWVACPVVLKLLLDAGLVHGDVLDRHRPDDGREPRRHRPARTRRRGRAPDRRSRSTARAASTSSRGSLAPDGAVSSRSPGCRPTRCDFEGPARVFDDESEAMEAILAGDDPSPARCS